MNTTLRNPTVTKHHRTERGTYTAGQIADGWRALRALSEPERKLHRKSPFTHFTESGNETLLKLSRMVTDGINAADPDYGRGRNWDDATFNGVRALAWDLNRRAIVRVESVRHLPKTVVARIAHRLYTKDDF